MALVQWCYGFVCILWLRYWPQGFRVPLRPVVLVRNLWDNLPKCSCPGAGRLLVVSRLLGFNIYHIRFDS